MGFQCGSAIAGPWRVNIDNVWYTDQQVAYIECSKTLVSAYIDVVTNGTYVKEIAMESTPNFSLASTASTIQKLITLDPNKQSGYVDVGWKNDGARIRVYIYQRPPAPTFTATSFLCTPGSSATFSVSVPYIHQGTKPVNIVWQTAGGVTVNSGTSHTTTSSTTSSVTIQYNSAGTVSVKAVIRPMGRIKRNAPESFWNK
nr:hypothetical protein [uncultured Dyadobacter sp.]